MPLKCDSFVSIMFGVGMLASPNAPTIAICMQGRLCNIKEHSLFSIGEGRFSGSYTSKSELTKFKQYTF